MPYIALYHPHAYFWMLLVLLFFVSFFLYRANIAKGAKITHMVLRLLYVIMIGTGVGMLVMIGFPLTHIIKGVLAIALIYFMEMILVRTKKGTLKPHFWFYCLGALALVLLLGYRIISF
ncbi:DUF1516 family protein [Anaerobacillus alkaliphilus]|uniref:DUF1516 family protein n=1 Tax=Anaerobacillus alkaliphilus TaxID=1548597 RepID=A0A4Q0VPF5_9BACI|nr:YisL family protein [Anaerobacillus alkaliphilus]RXI97747.1 DUF1516 family protein [Anaerobacillus alkaliphilus]